jgi:hypothetical protein
MKKQKESIVIFEDWFRYARCLNDSEFRTFMNTILQYYKEPFTPQFTGLMLEVWNDIIDDLKSNVEKKQAKRNTMLSNSRTNPKLNTVPDIGPDTILKIVPETAGMVDGRCEMGDDRWEINEKMVDGNGEMLDREFIISQFGKGVTTSSLIEQYPHSQSLITDTYIDYDF